MPASDADRLGPKGHVYVELVRERWRAPLERASVRRALITTVLGIALVVFGVVGALVANAEAIVAVAVGGVAVMTTLPALQALRPEFEEARRIGWVEPAFDDSIVTVGEPATVRIVLHARRALEITGMTMVAEAYRWEGAKPVERVASVPLPVTATGRVAAGQDWRETVTFRMPEQVPPSFYDATNSVRWSLVTDLAFGNAAPWHRAWPMLVFPPELS